MEYMKNEFKGFSKVFAFTLRQHAGTKGYRMATIIVSLICLILPALIMCLVTVFGGNKETYTSDAIVNVYVCDSTPQGDIDYNVLGQSGDEMFGNITYESFSDVDSALETAAGREDTLVLVVAEQGREHQLSVLLPDGTSLTQSDADAYADYINMYYPLVLLEKSGIAPEQVGELTTPVQSGVVSEEEFTAEDDGFENIREIFAMLIPYVIIMVLYFMILAYGQGVSNSAIMEKTSKLVDTFLISVKPAAMLFGKLLAIALTGIVQLFAWVISLVLGFFAGTVITKAIDPNTDMLLIKFFESFGSASGMFPLTGIILAIVIVLAGFLLYCSLAALGGAMASKPEDLSVTNMLFVFALMISFFSTLLGGAMGGSLDASSWQVYMPFSAVMVVPGMLLLGQITLVQALVSLLIMIVATLIVVWFAGRIYRTLIFYKGDALSLSKVFKLLKG